MTRSTETTKRLAWKRPAVVRMGAADAEGGGMMNMADQFVATMMMGS